MSVWASSPSPSVDVLSSQPSSSSSDFLVGWHVPHRLWDAYLAHLWYYQSNSWVGRLASTFRILAVILILPVVLLTLLDVTSYVIARTLGIVDDVKASTDTRDAQDKIGAAVPMVARVATTCASPSSSLSSTSSSLSDRAGISVGGSVRVSEEDSIETRTARDEDADEDGHSYVPKTAMASAAAMYAAQSITIQSQTHTSDVPLQAYYFTGEDDSLRLAGEGVFSPAVSVPPSPLTPRMPLHAFAESDGREIGQAGEGSVLRRRVQSALEDELGQA